MIPVAAGTMREKDCRRWPGSHAIPQWHLLLPLLGTEYQARQTHRLAIFSVITSSWTFSNDESKAYKYI